MNLRLVGLGLLTITLAACGTAAAKGTATSPSSSSPEPQSSTATVAQYASLVAGREVDLRKYIDLIGGCDPFADQNGLIACALAPLGVSTTADTLDATLEGAANTSAASYVGPPPSEIVALVDGTIGDVKAVDTANAAFQAASCANLAVAPCPALFMQVRLAASTLGHDLDAWKPYGA